MREIWAWGAVYKIKADAPTWPYGKESFIIFAGCRKLRRWMGNDVGTWTEWDAQQAPSSGEQNIMWALSYCTHPTQGQSFYDQWTLWNIGKILELAYSTGHTGEARLSKDLEELKKIGDLLVWRGVFSLSTEVELVHQTRCQKISNS